MVRRGQSPALTGADADRGTLEPLNGRSNGGLVAATRAMSGVDFWPLLEGGGAYENRSSTPCTVRDPACAQTPPLTTSTAQGRRRNDRGLRGFGRPCAGARGGGAARSGNTTTGRTESRPVRVANLRGRGGKRTVR